MNSMTYRSFQKVSTIFLFLFFLIFFSSCSTSTPTRYNQLGLLDLVKNKEDNIHTSRVSRLNTKISNTHKSINSYKNKIRLTKQAINSLIIEVSSYNFLISNVSNKINDVNQLNSFLDKLDNKIQNIEIKFKKMEKKALRLESLSSTEYKELQAQGYFPDLSRLDYIKVVKDVVNVRKYIKENITNSKINIQFIRNNLGKILKEILKKGAIVVLKRFIPPLAIADAIETSIEIGKWASDKGEKLWDKAKKGWKKMKKFFSKLKNLNFKKGEYLNGKKNCNSSIANKFYLCNKFDRFQYK